jgi:hypothetical protein
VIISRLKEKENAHEDADRFTVSGEDDSKI